MKPKLIIMVGNIASGKSTWIKNLLIDDPSYRVVSLDALRWMFGGGNYVYDLTLEPIIESLGINIMMALMAKDCNIIIDETNGTLSERARWLNVTNHYQQLGYDYRTIAAVMPFLSRHESLERRMKGKKLAWGSSKEVWYDVWTSKDDLYLEPKHSEGFNEIWRIEPQRKIESYTKENHESQPNEKRKKYNQEGHHKRY